MKTLWDLLATSRLIPCRWFLKGKAPAVLGGTPQLIAAPRRGARLDPEVATVLPAGLDQAWARGKDGSWSRRRAQRWEPLGGP